MTELLYEIDTTDAPVKLDKGSAVKFRVYALNFVQFCATMEIAAAQANYAAMQKAQRAKRRAAQIRAVDAAGAEFPVGAAELLRLPRMLYVRLMRDIERVPVPPGPPDDLGAPTELKGELVGVGDGIDKPITYKLTSPIKVQARSDAPDGADGDMLITELEFIARTGLEIEDVLCENTEASQTLALIRNCAKPLVAGADDNLGLMRLPDWAVEQITLADGVWILELVAPSFFGSAA